MTSCISASSAYPTPPAIAVIAANSPADVVFVRLIIVAGSAFTPAFLAAIPSVNATARYPSAIGIASRIPSQ